MPNRPLFLDPAAQNAYIAEHNKLFGHEYGSAEMMAGSLAKKETVHTVERISKFGGTIKTGAVCMIPEQTWNKEDKTYLALHPVSYYERAHAHPTHVVATAGIPGYTGHKPHNPKWSVPLRRPNMRAEHVRQHVAANGMADLIDFENYEPQKAHAPDHVSLQRDHFPSRKPMPGYTGFLPQNREHCFGTSVYRDKPPVTRAQSALEAKAVAGKRAEWEAQSRANDPRNKAGYDGDWRDDFSC